LQFYTFYTYGHGSLTKDFYQVKTVTVDAGVLFYAPIAAEFEDNTAIELVKGNLYILLYVNYIHYAHKIPTAFLDISRFIKKMQLLQPE
jgi:hypothetical protein